jgi:hypothetical protein
VHPFSNEKAGDASATCETVGHRILENLADENSGKVGGGSRRQSGGDDAGSGKVSDSDAREVSADASFAVAENSKIENKRGRMAPYPSRGFRWDEPRGRGGTAGSLTDVGSAP